MSLLDDVLEVLHAKGTELELELEYCKCRSFINMVNMRIQ